jgi:rubrerythrin
MELNTKEVLKKKILDAQEMVRDYEMYAKNVQDMEVSELFRTFAEESGYQASKLQEILKRIDNK